MNQPPDSTVVHRSRLPRVLLRTVLSLLALGGLAVGLLPYGVQWYLGDWLRERGVVNVSIGDVDINPFVGRFSVQSLEFEDDKGQHRAGHMALNLDWTELMNRRVRFSQVELRDATLEIRHTESNRWLIGTIVIGAQQAVEAAEEREIEAGWGFGIDQLRIEDVDIEYHDPIIDRALTVDSVTLENFASWVPAQATTVGVALSSGEARLTASGDTYPFADTFGLNFEVKGKNLDAAGLEALLEQVGIESLDGRLHTDFRINVTAPPDTGMTIAITGDLQLNDWVLTQPEQRLTLTNLAWDGNLDVNLVADISKIATQGTLRIDEMVTLTPTMSVNLASVNWQGLVTAKAGEQGEAVVLEGELEGAGLGFQDAARQLSTTLESLRWQGRVATASRDSWRLDAEGEISARQFSAGIADEPRMLTVSSLNAELTELRPGQLLSLAAIGVGDLNFHERAPTDSSEPAHMVSLSKIDIDTFVLAANTLAVGEVFISDAQVWLERDQDGNLALGAPDADETGVVTDQEPSVVESDEAESDADMAFSLAGVKTAGKSKLVYIDRSVKPMARLVITPLEIALGKIDAAHPEADTPIGLTASEGRYGQLAFDGQLRPLAEKSYLAGTGSIKDINLIELDGYARRAIGYAIKSGTLSSEVKVSLQGELLDAAAELTIRKLVLDPLQAEQQDEFSGELGVPLNIALALLEDDQQTIQLTVPMKGDLADLSVGVGDAVRLVMQKGLVAGMQTAATTYFAPLWPALAVTKLYAAASALRFEEVTFSPQTNELNDDQLAYIGNMAALLSKRPKVNLTVCGRSVAADVNALFPDAGDELGEEQVASLVALSEARQNAVKDRLIDAGIDSARLVTCAPEVRPEDEGLPRVVFGV